MIYVLVIVCALLIFQDYRSCLRVLSENDAKLLQAIEELKKELLEDE